MNEYLSDSSNAQNIAIYVWFIPIALAQKGFCTSERVNVTRNFTNFEDRVLRGFRASNAAKLLLIVSWLSILQCDLGAW